MSYQLSFTELVNYDAGQPSITVPKLCFCALIDSLFQKASALALCLSKTIFIIT